MPTSREIIEQGVAAAQYLLGPAAQIALAPVDFVRALEHMRDVEARLELTRQKLIALDAAGLARPGDFVAYDKVRKNVYAGTVRLVNPLLAWLRQHRPEVVARIPAPRMAPAVTPGSGRALQAAALAAQTGGLGRLGNPLLVAGAAAGAWPVVGVILAILAGLAIIALIAAAIMLTAEMVRDSIVAESQTRALEAAYAARQHVYDDCRGTGGNADDCANTAATLAPTPREALPQLPPPGIGWGWVPWALGALATTVLIGGALYVYANERGGRRSSSSFDGFHSPRPRAIRARPGRRAKRVYDLEVED